jgi:hypothetical protein
MDFNRNTTTIVEDANGAILTVNSDFDVVHIGVTNLVVCSVYKNFVENFVKTRNNFDIPFIRMGRIGFTCRPLFPSPS